jgi:GAF domain-containing protein
MTAVAAFLVMGLPAAGWTVFVASLASPLVQHVFARRLEVSREPGPLGPLGAAASNAIIHTAASLVSGALYLAAGGQAPLTTTDLLDLPQLTLLGVSYLAVNYFVAAVFVRAEGVQALARYLQALPRVAVYEGLPLVFSSLIAVIYTRLGPVELFRFGLLLTAATLVMRSLGLARQRLERRVNELDSLQAVGQALSASLNLAEVLEAAYTAVSRLMPASLFYVALSDPETGDVSFPLVRQSGRPVQWPPRPAGRGLTDHVLQTGQPLLIRQDVVREAERLGLETRQTPTASWLGAPLLSGGEALGVIAVHSDSPQQLYDETHRELLSTIAAQAALAIRNARLYARTDRSLARRVQELNSILQTAGEGILLLDANFRVLAANRALADFLGVPLGDVAGDVRQRRQHGSPPILEQIGY